MNAHDLARLLLDGPDFAIATFANGHSYASHGDRRSHGALTLVPLMHYTGPHLMIGNCASHNWSTGPWSPMPAPASLCHSDGAQLLHAHDDG